MEFTTERRLWVDLKKRLQKNTYFQIRMEQEIYDLLVTTARKQGVSKAEIVRRGIVAQAKLTKA